jgi:hypothetical protein
MSIRCVVTGQTPAGKSVFVSDSAVEPVTVNSLPGFDFYRLWGSDSTPLLPTDGTPPPQPRYFPPKEDSVFFSSPFLGGLANRPTCRTWRRSWWRCSRNSRGWPR